MDLDPAALDAARGRGDGCATVALARRLNGLMPSDLRVRRVVTAPDGFDARYSPLWRRYAYRICDGVPDPLTRRQVLSWPRSLDVAVMNEASADLLGLHDFAAFCENAAGQESTIVDVAKTDLIDVGNEIHFRIEASHFLWKMVRRLVGTLVEVGRGNLAPAAVGELLRGGKAGSTAAWTAPPSGLFLEEVRYARAPRPVPRRKEPARPADRPSAKRPSGPSPAKTAFRGIPKTVR
jgi:tRNA pseudouridine38-40 synthase